MIIPVVTLNQRNDDRMHKACWMDYELGGQESERVWDFISGDDNQCTHCYIKKK